MWEELKFFIQDCWQNQFWHMIIVHRDKNKVRRKEKNWGKLLAWNRCREFFRVPSTIPSSRHKYCTVPEEVFVFALDGYARVPIFYRFRFWLVAFRSTQRVRTSSSSLLRTRRPSPSAYLVSATSYARPPLISQEKSCRGATPREGSNDEAATAASGQSSRSVLPFLLPLLAFEAFRVLDFPLPFSYFASLYLELFVIRETIGMSNLSKGWENETVKNLSLNQERSHRFAAERTQGLTGKKAKAWPGDRWNDGNRGRTMVEQGPIGP